MKRQDKIFFRTALSLTEEVITHTQAKPAAKRNSNEKKLFSLVDLWNIQRRFKATLVR